MRRILFQDLSLPGQPRDRSRPLAEILAGEGIGLGRRIGVVGWKTFADRAAMETPAFLVDELRRLTGSGRPGRERDRPADRCRDGPARHERGRAAGCARVRRVPDVRRRPARADRAAAGDDRARGGRACSTGTGCRCRATLMLTAGPRARFGLFSPGDRPIERGDPFTVAFGVWGALDCRAGFVVEDATELPTAIDDYVERLVGALLRGRRRVVRGAAHRADRRRGVRRGHGRPRRSVLRDLPQPRAPDRPRRMDQLAVRGRIDRRAPLGDGVPGGRHPGHRHRLLHDQHRGRRRARRRVAAGRVRQRPTPRPGRGSWRVGGSCANHSGSSCTTTSCRSPISPRTCRRSCSGRTAR